MKWGVVPDMGTLRAMLLHDKRTEIIARDRKGFLKEPGSTSWSMIKVNYLLDHFGLNMAVSPMGRRAWVVFREAADVLLHDARKNKVERVKIAKKK